MQNYNFMDEYLYTTYKQRPASSSYGGADGFCYYGSGANSYFELSCYFCYLERLGYFYMFFICSL